MWKSVMTAIVLCLMSVVAQATTVPIPTLAQQIVLGAVVPDSALQPQAWRMAEGVQPVFYDSRTVVRKDESRVPYLQLVQTAPQEVTPPVVVIQTPPEDTTVDIDANWFVKEWFPIFGALLMSLVTWSLRFLPGYIQTAYRVFRIDQALKRSIDMAIARVVGASKDKKWSINVGNAVVAAALENFLASMPAKLTEWGGGKDGIVRKILSRVSEWLPPEFGDIKPAEVAADSAKPRTAMDTNIPPVKATTNFGSQFEQKAA